MWTGGETDDLVAGREFDVEPCNKSVDKIILPGYEIKWAAERQVSWLTVVEVKCEHQGWVSHNRLDLNCID